MVAAQPLDILAELRRMVPQVRCGAITVDTGLMRAGVVQDMERRIRELEAHVVRHGNEWKGAGR